MHKSATYFKSYQTKHFYRTSVAAHKKEADKLCQPLLKLNKIVLRALTLD